MTGRKPRRNKDIFEKVSKAYEFLCSRNAKKTDGPDPENIVLILKAQSILFKRYKELLEPYKYAGYPMLIKTIKLETHDQNLFSKPTPLLPAASELCYHTINCSALNAEELRREEGIELLQESFSRCVSVLNKGTKPNEMPVQVCEHIVRCYSVAAQFEQSREKITEIPAIVSDMCRILYFKNLTELSCVVAECVSNFSVDFWLQTHFLQSGALWHLLLFLFNYDYTLAESGVEATAETNQQEVSNGLARLSIRALARMGGYLDGPDATPDNPAVRKSLSAMLTAYVARKLSKEAPHEILKLLNSNTENPYLIWDNATRAELTEFLENEQSKKIRTGESDPAFGSEFVFSIHSKELIVGEIFVRIFNEQPTFTLEEPHKFGEALIDYLGSQAQYLHSLMALTSSEIDTSKSGGHKDRLDRIGMGLEALRNVIRNSPGVEVKCIGHFKLLFSLLRLTGATKLQQLALEVIASVTGNSKCVANIADADVLAYLLLILHTLPPSRPLVLETLHALMSSTKIVKEAMSKGALIYLLDLFCNSTNPNVRSRTAELFSKMMADKLIGPRVKIVLTKFLPVIFMDAMRDSPEASVHMFEANHENPELIWNDEAREKVSSTVKKMKSAHFKAQKDDPYVVWKIPDDFSITFDDVEGELVVGGVFLRLFISHPNWVLRKPKEFMVSLMDKFVNLTTKSQTENEILETVTQAIVCLFSAQPPLADQVPALGHIPQIFQVMASQNNAIPKSALQVIHVLSDNEMCVRTMAQTDSMRLMMAAMKKRPDSMHIAAEALNRMFDKNNSELVAQAVRVELVQFLLTILDSLLSEVKNPSGTKAQIVKALKAMCRDLNQGEQVNNILEASTVWTAFRDQKHDLFISDQNTAGYLTGPVGAAGYLTQGPSNNAAMSAAPPPIDTHDHDDQ